MREDFGERLENALAENKRKRAARTARKLAPQVGSALLGQHSPARKTQRSSIEEQRRREVEENAGKIRESAVTVAQFLKETGVAPNCQIKTGRFRREPGWLITHEKEYKEEGYVGSAWGNETWNVTARYHHYSGFILTHDGNILEYDMRPKRDHIPPKVFEAKPMEDEKLVRAASPLLREQVEVWQQRFIDMIENMGIMD